MILLALAPWVTQSKGKGKPLNQFPEELGLKGEKKVFQLENTDLYSQPGDCHHIRYRTQN